MKIDKIWNSFVKNSIQKLITDDDNTPSQTTKSESSEKNFEKLLIEKINKN